MIRIVKMTFSITEVQTKTCEVGRLKVLLKVLKFRLILLKLILMVLECCNTL